MFVNVLPDSVEEAIAFPRGTQNLVQCGGCGFVFNRSFSQEKVVYGADYHAERGHSAYYLQHIRRVADFIEYEHCAYYTDQFMPRLLNAAGFEIIAFEKSYDGQYFSICAKKCEVPTHVALAANEELRCVQESFSALLHTYSEVNCAEVLQSFCTETLQPAPAGCRISLNAADGIYLWGATAKGVMCAVLLNRWPIAGLIDQNQYKAGKYIAGTGYPVLSPSQIKYPSVQGVIIENDAYTEEITAEVRKIDPNISVLSLSKLLGT